MENLIKRAAKIADVPISAAFIYGSRVYGTATYSSDYDLVVISDQARDGHEIRNGDLNIHLYTPVKFQENLTLHKVVAVECYHAPDCYKYGNVERFRWVVDKATLRREFSEKASNSWVKGKKKLDVEGDFYIGRKSIFHSLRIIKFGIQLAMTGRITDFGAANDLYQEIVQSPEENWAFFKEKYQPLYNELSSEFRRLAPK
jgi:predicted nucleotidyltransferase